MDFDIREHLTPKRLTIAMWDYSWLYAHYPSGAYEDYDRVTDELLDRGFNTVRIEAFPWVVGQLDHPDEKTTVTARPLATWGVSDIDRQHAVALELAEFMAVTQRKGMYVILSTWGQTHPEYPDKEPDRFVEVWEKTLAFLEERDLLSHVLYVDLDQEFPYFSAHAAKLKALGEPAGDSEGTTDASDRQRPRRGFKWNDDQLDYVGEVFNQSIARLQRLYPAQRFTISLTSFWDECRVLNLKCFDVLEVHCWIHGPSFDNRTGFYDDLVKDRGSRSYTDYQRRIDAAFAAMRPMLKADMHQRLAAAAMWGREICAPVTTTEAWGPWWHMDHPDLRWDWLRDWCAECNRLAAQYGFWGSTPWNFSHPYWENWSDVSWYREVNNAFLATAT